MEKIFILGGREQSKYEVLIPSSSSDFIQKLTQIKFLLGLKSSHRIPASGYVGGDRWWWGLPTTATAASSGSTAASLLPSSQYNGDRRGKKEQGLGFVWGCSDQQKIKRDGVRLEWFYGGRRCSGSRWSLVVEWRLAGGAVAISRLPKVAAPSCSLKSGTKERNGVMSEFEATYSKLFDELEAELAQKGKAFFNDAGEQAAFRFLGRAYLETNPEVNRLLGFIQSRTYALPWTSMDHRGTSPS
ncbi:unnamed protein product [Lactuca virosa]|uniref:Uncharacterized protein n=1 Tax=Lactuca virosa TaxID=75947 RepID=A0AAU9M928_9ASTR|nr:unnamed protein product [Lactuca virosa]